MRGYAPDPDIVTSTLPLESQPLTHWMLAPKAPANSPNRNTRYNGREKELELGSKDLEKTSEFFYISARRRGYEVDKRLC